MARHLAFIILLLVHIVKSEHYGNQPNVILFNADDLGWGDLSSYGHPTQEWSPIDDLAREGMRFTNMYAGAPNCAPSGSALMTGRMPIRIGTYGPSNVFQANSVYGLPRDEITLAEALQDVGYFTGMVGKWHLGINANNHTDGTHLPYNHGFEYVGHNLPLTNAWGCDEEQIHVTSPNPLQCFLYDNATIVQQPYSHKHLTELFVKDTVGFMRSAQRKGKPFFMYFALAQPHVNLFNNPGFVGSSIRGRYGDNIREIAWAVAAIMEEVGRLDLDDNTIVLFISDNGPQLELCNEGGDAGVLKGGKTQYWEGGIRVPGIVRWTGRIKPGVVNNELVSQLDIFPTVLSLAGGRIPGDRVIDGQDISRTLFNLQGQTQPKPSNTQPIFVDKTRKGQTQVKPRMLLFYCHQTPILFAVRYSSYKFHFKTQTTSTKEEDGEEFCESGGFPVDFYNFNCNSCDDPDCVETHDPPLMYNVDEDPNEAYPLDVSLSKHKDILDEMMVELEIVESGLVIGPSLFKTRSDDVTPCCTPETFPECTCNYPPVYKGRKNDE